MSVPILLVKRFDFFVLTFAKDLTEKVKNILQENAQVFNAFASI